MITPEQRAATFGVLFRLSLSFMIVTEEQLQDIVDDSAPGTERANEPVHQIAKEALTFKKALQATFDDFTPEIDTLGPPFETCACGKEAHYWIKKGQVPICEECKEKIFHT